MCIWKMLPVDGNALVYLNFFEAWDERAIFAVPESGRANGPELWQGPLAQSVRASDS